MVEPETWGPRALSLLAGLGHLTLEHLTVLCGSNTTPPSCGSLSSLPPSLPAFLPFLSASLS